MRAVFFRDQKVEDLFSLVIRYVKGRKDIKLEVKDLFYVKGRKVIKLEVEHLFFGHQIFLHRESP